MVRGFYVLMAVLILVAGCATEERGQETPGPPPTTTSLPTQSPEVEPPTAETPPSDKWSQSDSATSTGGYITVPPLEAADIIQSQAGAPDFVIIDMRTLAEREEVRIPGDQLHMDFDGLDFEDSLEALDRGTTYMIYCQSGSRTPEAMDMMAGMGFSTVYEIEGGIEAWEAAGLAVED